MKYILNFAKLIIMSIVFFNLLVFCQMYKEVDLAKSNKPIDLTLGGFVYATAFSSNEGDFAAGGSKKIVKVWDTKTWRLKYELKHPEMITDMAFVPSQKILATVNNELGNGGSSNVRILFWNVETGENISTYKEDNCPQDITSISISPNGKLMAVGFGNGLVKLLSLEVPNAVKVINEKIVLFDSGVSSLRFSPNSQFLAIGAGKGISGPKDFGTFKVMDVKNGREIFNETSLAIIHNLAFSPDEKILAVAASKKENREIRPTLIFYDTSTWKQLEEKKDYSVGKGLEFSPNGELLISASPSALQSKIVVWNLTKKKSLVSFKSNKSITSLTLSPTGTLIAAGNDDGHIQIFPIPR